MSATAAEVAIGNAKLAEIKDTALVAQLLAALLEGKEAKELKAIEQNEIHVRHIMRRRHGEVFNQVAQADKKVKANPTVSVSRRPVYRFKFDDELTVEDYLKKVNTELNIHEDEMISQSRASNDPKLKEFVAQYDEITRKHVGASEALQGKIVILGFAFDTNIRQIAEYRAQLYGDKQSGEQKKDEIVKKAEAKFRAEIPDTVKDERDLDNLVSDIQSLKGWMFDSVPGCDMSEYLVRMQDAQKHGKFKGVSHLFVYSTNKGQVVYAKRVKNLRGPGYLFNPTTYYTGCTAEEAQFYFDKVTGGEITAPPKETDTINPYATTTI